MLTLRPYQNELIVGARSHFRAGHKRVLIQLATGGGKTALCARMLHNAASRNKRVWFVVHRRELVAQVARAFDLEGIRYGLVTSDTKMNLAAPAQICSVQTLINRLDRVPAPDLIAFDECHHIRAAMWGRIVERHKDAYHVGLSATPRRLDGAGLGPPYFQRMICGPSPAWLIENGFLSKYRLFRPNTVDVSGLHKRMGDYIASESAALVNRPVITGDAIGHYRKHCPGARALAFCVSVEHSKAVAAAFMAAGIPALHVDGKTHDHLRDQMMADFAAGKIRVICNVDLFGEGYDCPALEAVILLRPTASVGMYMQQVGRALRTAPGKEYAIILDHVGNSLQHGDPDEERVWELTPGKEEKEKPKVPPPRTCGYCWASNRAGATHCKVCKRAFPVESRQVDQVDGELDEVNQDELAARRAAKVEQGMAQTLEALTQIGTMRYGPDKGPRWAMHVWEARQKKQARGG
jgi:superfamily II DNA or RNA helicase